MWDKDGMAPVFVLKKSILWRWHNFEGAELRMMALNSWALAKVTKAWKGRSDGDGSVFGGGKGQLWSKVMEHHLSCPLQYHPCITIHHVPTNTTSLSESTQKYHLYISSYKYSKMPPLFWRFIKSTNTNETFVFTNTHFRSITNSNVTSIVLYRIFTTSANRKYFLRMINTNILTYQPTNQC